MGELQAGGNSICTGRQPPPLSYVLNGIIRRFVLAAQLHQVPRELAISRAYLVAQWYSYVWWKLKMIYHTVYPCWDGPSVVCYLFLYLFISAPTTAFTWLSTFCIIHLSSTFYLSQDTSLVQGFIFEGDLQFSKSFKMTICKGKSTLKCTEKSVILFTPLHLLHKFVPCRDQAINTQQCKTARCIKQES